MAQLVLFEGFEKCEVRAKLKHFFIKRKRSRLKYSWQTDEGKKRLEVICKIMRECAYYVRDLDFFSNSYESLIYSLSLYKRKHIGRYYE